MRPSGTLPRQTEKLRMRATRRRRGRECLVGALSMLAAMAHSVLAAPPPDADPALAPWFNSLRQPWTNALCCSMADCRPVVSRLSDGHYDALIDGEWRRVPDHLILIRSD